MSDTDILARTIYGEARGEGATGQKAVTNVVLNRVAHPDHPHFGKGSITDCCLAPYQFSCWNKNDPNLSVIENITDEDPIFAQCLQIASDGINGLFEDNTGGATFYYVKGSPEPAWAIDKEPCAIIGRHLFFKDIA